MNRRDFIKIGGAVGVCLVTPRIGSSSALIEDGILIDEEPNMVTLEVRGLREQTSIWIGLVDDQGIGHKTIWRGESTGGAVAARLPVEYDGQQVVMRTIHRDALYNQMQFVADRDQKVYVRQVEERNFVNYMNYD